MRPHPLRNVDPVGRYQYSVWLLERPACERLEIFLADSNIPLQQQNIIVHIGQRGVIVVRNYHTLNVIDHIAAAWRDHIRPGAEKLHSGDERGCRVGHVGLAATVAMDQLRSRYSAARRRMAGSCLNRPNETLQELHSKPRTFPES